MSSEFPTSPLLLPRHHNFPMKKKKRSDEYPFCLAPILMESKSILSIMLPMVMSGLLLYSRSVISMVFLGRLGPLPLAGGSLALGFANITGYSVLSGLSSGMDPICGQSHGASRPLLLGLSLRRTVLLLLSASLPISLLWLCVGRILLLCRQHPDISLAAHSFILFSLPDLLLQSFLHPLRAYFRSQSITLPLAAAAAAAAALHLSLNRFLSGFGIPGVALSSVLSNLALLLLLLSYLYLSGAHRRTGGLIPSAGDDTFSLSGWRSLLSLALPGCLSVCLEWWCYEIMILLCGLLLRPQSAVASMGLLIQTTSFIYIFPSSLAAGVSTRVANELGANRPHHARRAAAVGLAAGALLGFAALAFSLSIRNLWPRLFTSDPDIVALTAAVLPVLGLCELGNCPQTAGCAVLRGSARPRAAANINLASFYGVGLPVAVMLAFWTRLDFSGLWLGLLAAQAACLSLMLAVIASTDWEIQAERAQCLTGSCGADEQGCKPVSFSAKTSGG